ncbi:hypothetical protein TSUD_146690 [Trifolium subterraneum]|uniref:DRBM domain-containing protein n=1 Tax=Trifolium subterraneum TaxID=3900 RepID=A0A2Z6M7P6_TRISU|nr:hypothetical protein TSUD_146690 [Trifolium subterraneum]
MKLTKLMKKERRVGWKFYNVGPEPYPMEALTWIRKDQRAKESIGEEKKLCAGMALFLTLLTHLLSSNDGITGVTTLDPSNVSKGVPRSLASIIIWKDKFVPKSPDFLQVVHAMFIISFSKQPCMIHLYKTQLQIYAQKRNLKLPEYSPEWEGPPHAMRFKCKVTIDGQTFESPKFYSTLKEAEHAAAETALTSLSPSGIQEAKLVQKEGLQLPVYSTNKSGEAHKPIFSSQVEIEGEIFTGPESKSKKQAEMSAAKVAYTTLKERKALGGQSPDCSKEKVTTGLQHQSNGESSVSSGLVIQNPAEQDKVEKKLSPENTNGCSGVSVGSKTKAVPSVSDSNNFDFQRSIMSSNAVSSPSRPKKVIVYSTKTNIEIEKGGTLLPISDDKWVAYSYSH